MKHYSWFVFTNCSPGSDADFNDWYDNIHIPDLLRVPGITGCRRLNLTETQMATGGPQLSIGGPADIGAKYRYLAIYSIESDDIEAVLQDLIARAGTEQMWLSPSLQDTFAVVYEG